MIRIYADLKINVSDIKNIGEKFIIKFYTTSKSVAIKKTDLDIVDGVIKLNWSELATIGRGVLQYELNNITEDADYDDGIYDSTYTGTTEYYIMSDISIDEDDEDTPITEVIADIKNDINSLDTAKQDKLTAGENITIENNVISATFDGDDIDLSNYYNKSEIDNMEQVVAASLNDLNTRLGTKANTSDVYTKSEVDQAIDEVIAGGVADLTNYYTKSESDAKYATQTVINEEIAARITAIREVNTTVESKADKSEIPTVPTNVSAFTNDAGYLTQHQSLSNYYTKSEIDTMVGDIETLLSNI